MDKVIITKGELGYILGLIIEDVNKDRQQAEEYEAKGEEQNALTCRDYVARYGAYVDKLSALIESTDGDIAIIPA